jgi:YegS/Rv2252/BmrU family lipid kinase
MKKLLIIANPKAGKIKKEKFRDLLYNEFNKQFSTEIIFTEYKGHGHEIINSNYDNHDFFVVYGGDGSINELARELLYKDKPLGIIPGGSGNGLAKGLGIPFKTKEAIEIIKNQRIINIDAGKINNDYFFNIAGIGLDAWISRDFNERPLGRGIPPYVLYGFLNYIKMPPFLSEIHLEGEKNKIIPETLILTFSNFKEWGGNTYIAPTASPIDGKLDLCLIEKFPLHSVINLPKLFTGKIDSFKYYQNYKINKVTVKTPNPQIYHFDGEKGKWASTFQVEALSLALKIIVPKNINY